MLRRVTAAVAEKRDAAAAAERRPNGCRRAALCLGKLGAAVGAWSLATPARAADVELSSQTYAQAYEVASPWEGSSLERRRLMQMVGFSMYRLQGDTDASAADYSFRLSMRLDSDFGLGNHLPARASDAETRWDRLSGSYYVPGLRTAELDLMYGYLEGRRLAGGWLGFRAGRQYLTDVLGWWSFDGALARVSTPWYFELEAYGGLEQRGGLPLSTGRFEAQGVWRGRHDDLGGRGQPRPADFPGYQEASVAPAFGAAIETNGPSFVHARLSYRRVYNTGEASTRLFGEGSSELVTIDELRTSSERIGGSAQLIESSLGGLRGGLAYDLYGQLFASAYAGADAFVHDDLTLGADFDHVEPVFDADSIFNWFTKSPVSTATLRGTWRLSPEVELSGAGGVRVWGTEGDPSRFGSAQCVALGREPGCRDEGFAADAGSGALRDASRDEALREGAALLDGLGHLAGRYRGSLGRVELRALVQSGARARQLGAELAGERVLDGGRYAVGARLSLYDVADRLSGDEGPGTRGSRDGTLFSYVLGTGFRPHETTRMAVEWEHATSSLVGQRFRVLGSLELRWIQ